MRETETETRERGERERRGTKERESDSSNSVFYAQSTASERKEKDGERRPLALQTCPC